MQNAASREAKSLAFTSQQRARERKEKAGIQAISTRVGLAQSLFQVSCMEERSYLLELLILFAPCSDTFAVQG